MDFPSNKEVMEYIAKMGKHGGKTLSILGKSQDFINAVNSQVGKQLLEDLILQHEALLIKIARFDATDEDKADFKAVGRMLLVWTEKIVAYESKLRQLKREMVKTKTLAKRKEK
jgi:hypothetical protein